MPKEGLMGAALICHPLVEMLRDLAKIILLRLIFLLPMFESRSLKLLQL